jgi:hypothetical protein
VAQLPILIASPAVNILPVTFAYNAAREVKATADPIYIHIF